MCGIAGMIEKRRAVSGHHIEKMLQVMQHRGPDSLEVRCWQGLGLGHVRLAIVDLSDDGLQPMCDHTGRFWIVFNGEIFNFIELRQELKKKGHQFKTKTDTEVILEAYKAWGENCLNKFNGMWALAIYDQQQSTCFLARDRFGIKPLHYAEENGRFVFASEIKAIIAAGVTPIQNDQMARAYFSQDTTDDGEKTLFKNILSVPPGTYLSITNGNIKTVRWWQTSDHLIDLPKKFSDRVSMFDELLLDATRIRLRNDVKTALTLSGGMDSSTLFGMTRRLEQNKQWLAATTQEKKTLDVFSITQPGQPSDESYYVKECLKAFGGETHWIDSDPKQFAGRIDHVIAAQEAPVWSSAVFGFHDVYRQIAKAGIRVVIEGHGSDEMLAGYPYLVRAGMQSFLARGQYLKAYSAAKAVNQTQNPNLENQRLPNWLVMMSGIKKTSRLAWHLGYYRSRILGKKQPPVYLGELDYLKPLMENDIDLTSESENKNNTSLLKQQLDQAFHHRIMPTNLRVLDRASMASSLEIRMPFMDYRVVQFCFSLSDSDLVAQGQSKHLLRKMAKPYVPKKVIQRKAKMGYSVDAPYWFRDKNIRSYLSDIFQSQDFKEQSWIDGKRFNKGFDRCMADRFGWLDASKTWKVLNFYLWRKRFVQSHNPMQSTPASAA